MIATIFIVGLLSALGCGFNIVATKNSDWKLELVWTLGGATGGALMLAALYLSRVPA
ncbi:hypothetical protein [Mesorhizobium sp. M0768]|uniref:hypothetical protein n=1 Tax=unclassified Mesorhizobium TaxID=325217 RepID=UPI0033394383